MDSLPPIDIAGVSHFSLSLAQTIPLDGEIIGHVTQAGAVVLGRGGTEILLLTPRGDRRYAVGDRARAMENSAGPRIDVHGDRVAVASRDRLSVFDATSARWHAGPALARGQEFSCTFTSSGELWLLEQSGEDTLLSVYAPGAYEQPLAAMNVDLGRGEGGSWWLDCAHPTEPRVPLTAGMGQDGSITAIAHLGAHGLELRDVERDACFAAWTPTGDGSIRLGHGDQAVRFGRQALSKRLELAPLFDAIDDGLGYRAAFLDENRVLIPTGEGRLLAVDVDGQGVAELRLMGDSRNWDWSFVALVGDRLITSRHEDSALSVWDARPLR